MKEYRAERNATLTEEQRVARKRSQKAYEERHPDRVKEHRRQWAAQARADGYFKRWREQNPEKMRQYYLKKHYGITPEEYDAMLAEQDGHCAICPREPAEGEYLRLDHCHATLRRRGLLCHNCNVVLGLMADDPELLRAAARYLEESRSLVTS